jgi:hypothetical protein
VLTANLDPHYLKRGIPIMTGLSATYLYNTAREYDVDGRVVYDDVRGESVGHFVVLAGYNRQTRRALVADPFLPTPWRKTSTIAVDIDRLVCAIMLGILTYDGDLLIIQPPKTKRKGAKACTSRFTGR